MAKEDRIIPEFKHYMEMSPSHPTFIIDVPSVQTYLRSVEASESYEESILLYNLQEFSFLGSKEYFNISWVDEMVSKVKEGQFYREELTDEVISIMGTLSYAVVEIDNLCRLSHGDADSYFYQNTRYLLGKAIGFIGKKDFYNFWQYSKYFEDYLVASLASDRIYYGALEGDKELLSVYFKYKDSVWRKSYEDRIKFGELEFDTGIPKRTITHELVDDINLYMPYISFKLTEALFSNKLNEEARYYMEYFKERGLLTESIQLSIHSVASSFKTERYNHTSLFTETLRLFLKGEKIVVPIPDKLKGQISVAATMLRRYLSKENLIHLYIDSYQNAYLETKLQIFTQIREEMYTTIEYNTLLLYRKGVISEDEAKEFIRQGKVKYLGKN